MTKGHASKMVDYLLGVAASALERAAKEQSIVRAHDVGYACGCYQAARNLAREYDFAVHHEWPSFMEWSDALEAVHS